MNNTIFPDIREGYHEYEYGIELFKKYYESGSDKEKIDKIINNMKSHRMKYLKESDDSFPERDRYIVECEMCKYRIIHPRILEGVIIDKERIDIIYERFPLSCEEIVKETVAKIKNDVYLNLSKIYKYYNDKINEKYLHKIIREEVLKIPDLLTIENIIK